MPKQLELPKWYDVPQDGGLIIGQVTPRTMHNAAVALKKRADEIRAHVAREYRVGEQMPTAQTKARWRDDADKLDALADVFMAAWTAAAPHNERDDRIDHNG